MKHTPFGIMKQCPAMSIVVAVLVLTFSGIAGATVIYDNGLPGEAGGLVSDYDSRYAPNPSYVTFAHQAGDDFVLGAGANTITDIHWWGFRRINPESYENEFTIQIFQFSGGMPGAAPIYSYDTGTITGTQYIDESVGIGLSSYVYEYFVNIDPLVLTADQQYLLSIICHTGTPELYDDVWAWKEHDDVVGDAQGRQLFDLGLATERIEAWEIAVGQTPSGPVGYELAFQLTGPGTSVPEPSTFLLLCVGVLGVIGSRKMK